MRRFGLDMKKVQASSKLQVQNENKIYEKTSARKSKINDFMQSALISDWMYSEWSSGNLINRQNFQCCKLVRLSKRDINLGGGK